MNINLERDICFFDLEATGLNIVSDRIIQIAIIKIKKSDHSKTTYHQLINPGAVLISEEAFLVHGISSESLRNKPLFNEVAQDILNFIGDSDLGGYNSNRFDIPLLMEEFSRSGLEFNILNRRTVDVQQIFYKMEPRTLRAALKFYCDKDLVNGHDALVDVEATIQVFESQLEFYENKNLLDENGEILPNPIVRDVQALHNFTSNLKVLDATQRLKLNSQGVVVFNFGKYVNQSVKEVFTKEKFYYQWIMNNNFSAQVKEIITNIMNEIK